MNADLISQIELLKQENLILRQSLGMHRLSGVSQMPFLSSQLSLEPSINLGLGLGLPQQPTRNPHLLMPGSSLAGNLSGRLLPSSSVLGIGHRGQDSQSQLVQALLMQQERDQANLRDHLARDGK